LWMTLAHRNVSAAQAALSAVDAQLLQSHLELDQLQVQLRLQGQLQVQHQILTRLGLPVETSRVISTLAQLMPKEMSILDLSMETEESLRQTPAGTAKSAKAGARDRQQIDRRLRVRLLAVAPSDVDLANFLAGLTSTPFFQDVSPTFGRDKSDGGHLMREFEVTFSVCLNMFSSSGGR